MKKLIQSHFFKFLIVGGLGTITNLTLFFMFVDILNFHHIPVAIGVFAISAIQNYLFNHYWTFSDRTNHTSANIHDLLKFLLLATIALAINLLILSFIINVFDPQFKVFAQIFGIAGGTIINFIGSKYWIFDDKK